MCYHMLPIVNAAHCKCITKYPELTSLCIILYQFYFSGYTEDHHEKSNLKFLILVVNTYKMPVMYQELCFLLIHTVLFIFVTVGTKVQLFPLFCTGRNWEEDSAKLFDLMATLEFTTTILKVPIYLISSQIRKELKKWMFVNTPNLHTPHLGTWLFG